MKYFKLITVYLLCCSVNHIYSQDTSLLSIQFVPQFESKPLILEETTFKQDKDSIIFEVLKFYISNVELYDQKKLVFSEENSFHLLDASESSSLKFLLNVPTSLSFSTIKFNIGIDSLTNCSGVFGGDLDPSNGMYWTWQSGYINFKLEGISNTCPSRNNRFQFHIGGYATPYNSLQVVRLPIEKTDKLEIQIELATFLEKLNMKEQYEVMSPNRQAMEVAQWLPSIFAISN